MGRFTEVLEQTRARLDLPQPAKSRILLEISADLDDLYHAYLRQGLGEGEAARRAVETLDLSDESLAELIELHRSAYMRLLDRMSEQARNRWERAMLIATLLVVAVLAGPALLSADLFRVASIFVWPAAGVLLLGLGVFLRKIYQIRIRKDHDPRRLYKGLGALVVLSGIELGIGFYGFLLEFYWAALDTFHDAANAVFYVLDLLIAGSAMVVLALSAALIMGILWYGLVLMVTRIEQAEAAFLMEN